MAAPRKYDGDASERQRAARKAYYERHRERILEKKRADYKNGGAQLAAERRLQADPELLRESKRRSCRSYRERHPERMRAARRRWIENNAERVRERQREYRARKKEAQQ